MDSFKVKTTSKCCMLDITRDINRIIHSNNIKSGLCCIFIPHTTACVTINENADPSVVKDILLDMDRLVPDSKKFLHMEGNSDAHIKSSLFGFSENIIIENGELVLGTWQGIYFCEFDGPRNRTVNVKLIQSN